VRATSIVERLPATRCSKGVVECFSVTRDSKGPFPSLYALKVKLSSDPVSCNYTCPTSLKLT